MNKKLSFLLVVLLFISTGINFYFFNSGNKDKIEFSNDISTEKTINKNKKNNVLKKISINEFITDDSLTLSSVYNSTDSNLFKLGYFYFKNNVNDYKSYKKWRMKTNYKIFILGIARLGDKESWNKFYNFLIDFYTEKNKTDFTKEFKKNTGFNKDVNGRKNFMLFVGKYFDDINNSRIINATIDNIGNDMNMSFSTNPINEAITLCKSRKDSELPHIPCIDDSYFYRATKENKYCDKISDKFKSRVCKDFLLYQDSL